MKWNTLSLVVCLITSFSLYSNAQTQKSEKANFFDTVVNQHNQIFPVSGIPSAIEMVLKYSKVVDFNFYDLQNRWGNKSDGSFRDFDHKEFSGITFSHKFMLPRDAEFPADSLFRIIEDELKLGKKVIIALRLENAWPIFVVHEQTPDGEFVSYSKHGSHTLIVRNTKEIVNNSKGTEIMTYTIPTKM